jgi:hypothetical protein
MIDSGLWGEYFFLSRYLFPSFDNLIYFSCASRHITHGFNRGLWMKAESKPFQRF